MNEKNFIAGRQYWITPLSQKAEQEFSTTRGEYDNPQPSSLFKPLSVDGNTLILQYNVKSPREFLEKMHNLFIERNTNAPTRRTIYFFEYDDDMRTKHIMWHGSFTPQQMLAPPPALSDGAASNGAAATPPAAQSQPYPPSIPLPYYGQPEAKSLRATNEMLTAEVERLRNELDTTRKSLSSQIEENQRIRSTAQSEKNELISKNIETERQLEILRGQAEVFNERLEATKQMAVQQATMESSWQIKNLTEEATKKDAAIAELQSNITALQQQINEAQPAPGLADKIVEGITNPNPATMQIVGALADFGSKMIDLFKDKRNPAQEQYPALTQQQMPQYATAAPPYQAAAVHQGGGYTPPQQTEDFLTPTDEIMV